MKGSLRLFIFFILSIFSSNLFSDGGVGLNVFLQSPKLIQRAPGEVFTIAFFVQNTSAKTDNFIGRIIAPDGWETIPSPLPTIYLKENQQTIQIFGVKIPKYAEAGQYEIQYELQGTSYPDLKGLASLSVTVLPVENLEMHLEKAKDNVFSGKTYTLDVSVANFGNKKKIVN